MAYLFDSDRLSALLEHNHLDGVVAHTSHHYYYLSGFESLDYTIEEGAANYVLLVKDTLSSCVTIPSSERLSLLVDPCWVPNRYISGSFYVKDDPITDGVRVQTPWAGLVAMLRDAGLTDATVGFELEHLSSEQLGQIRSEFPQMRIADASRMLRLARSIKTAEEVGRIEEACRITDVAMEQAIRECSPTLTDSELASRIAEHITKLGGQVVYVQVATAATAGLGKPQRRDIHLEDIVRLDVSASYRGYHSDLGRTFVYGDCSAKEREIYSVASQALDAGIGAVRVGATTGSVFEAAMSVWKAAGYNEVRRHHVGHGVGLSAHEEPMLGPGGEDVIQPGMVLAVEVPYYVYGVGGFAPEDVVVVDEDGAVRRITHAPEQLLVVPVEKEEA